MADRIRRLRRALAGEEAMTLVELLVTVSLLTVVTGIFLSVMTSVQFGVERQSDRSSSVDQARLAVQELDREIRSGNVLHDPAATLSGYQPNYYLVIYSQANATTRSPENRCVQWRISTNLLQRRDWSIADPVGTVTAWRIVADHIVNLTQSPTVPAFQLDPAGLLDPSDPSKGGRTVIVTILADVNVASGSPVRFQTYVTGRNTASGYPSSVCDLASVPPA